MEILNFIAKIILWFAIFLTIGLFTFLFTDDDDDEDLNNYYQ